MIVHVKPSAHVIAGVITMLQKGCDKSAIKTALSIGENTFRCARQWAIFNNFNEEDYGC